VSDTDEIDWPTPEFKRAGAAYHCARCGDVVVPSRGDVEAALLKAGRTTKVCEDCADELLDAIEDGDQA